MSSLIPYVGHRLGFLTGTRYDAEWVRNASPLYNVTAVSFVGLLALFAKVNN